MGQSCLPFIQNSHLRRRAGRGHGDSRALDCHQRQEFHRGTYRRPGGVNTEGVRGVNGVTGVRGEWYGKVKGEALDQASLCQGSVDETNISLKS